MPMEPSKKPREKDRTVISHGNPTSNVQQLYFLKRGEVHTLCYSPEVNPRGIAVDPSSGYVYFTTSDAIYYLSPTSHTPIQFVNGLQDSYGVPVSLTMDVSGYIFMSTTNVTALVAPTGYVTVLDDVPHNANIAVTADHLLYVSKDGTVTVVKGDDYCCDSMGG
jgi:DNA-binding beta-propeller fold protein YncE